MPGNWHQSVEPGWGPAATTAEMGGLVSRLFNLRSLEGGDPAGQNDKGRSPVARTRWACSAIASTKAQSGP